MREKSEQWTGVRIGGFSAILFGTLLAVQMVASRIAGADVTSDTNWPATFTQIIENRQIFTLSGGVGALAAAALLPALLGFYFTVSEEDRPYFFVAASFSLLSAFLIVDAYAHYGNLVGTAIDYTTGFTAETATTQVGDSMGDQFQILQFAGLVSFGISAVILGRLMQRSSFYQKPFALLSVSVGASSLLYVSLPIALTALRLLWAFSLGTAWLRSTQPGAATIVETVPA
jgi:Domain of unknown function (DUF4386)